MKLRTQLREHQAQNPDFYYLRYTSLERRVGDILDANPADVISYNTFFEEALASDICCVNNSFERVQLELFSIIGFLSDNVLRMTCGGASAIELSISDRVMHRKPFCSDYSVSTRSPRETDTPCDVSSASDDDNVAALTSDLQVDPSEIASSQFWPHACHVLAFIMWRIEGLVKYAELNSIAVGMLLLKRRKATKLFIESSLASAEQERSDWLSQLSFFNGLDIANLYLAVESLGREEALSPANHVQDCDPCLPAYVMGSESLSHLTECDCGKDVCWKCIACGRSARNAGASISLLDDAARFKAMVSSFVPKEAVLPVSPSTPTDLHQQ